MTVWLVKYDGRTRLYPDLRRAFLAMTVMHAVLPNTRITCKRMTLAKGLA